MNKPKINLSTTNQDLNLMSFVVRRGLQADPPDTQTNSEASMFKRCKCIIC